MNLDDFETSWKMLKLQPTLPPLSKEDILQLIEKDENKMNYLLNRSIYTVSAFIFLLFICQGG